MIPETQDRKRNQVVAIIVQVIQANWLFFAFLLALISAFVLLQTRPTQGIESLADLEALASSGAPLVVEFYSNL